ncbi:MAG: hypothetical protein JXR53_09340 [Bacteroidales bacterium]|nr:hypothetical protein [Bacteroidales bacterium]
MKITLFGVVARFTLLLIFVLCVLLISNLAKVQKSCSAAISDTPFVTDNAYDIGLAGIDTDRNSEIKTFSGNCGSLKD